MPAVRPVFADKNWVYWCPHQPDPWVKRLLLEQLGLHDTHPPSQRAKVGGGGATEMCAAFGLHYEASTGK